MFGTVITAFALAAAASPPVTPARIAGTYVVEGGCRNGPSYNGTITIAANGENYALAWKIGEDTYAGSALETDGMLAISFMAGNQTGAMYMRRDTTGWTGKWAMMLSGVACHEHWTPRG